jgi:seryl-tRNA synthetase
MNLDEPQNQEQNDRSKELSEPDENPVSEELFASTQAATDFQTATILKDQIQQLRKEIADLQAAKAKMQHEQMALTETMGNLVSETLSQLEQRRQTLQIEVEKLERRRERIQNEMRTSFAGVSQDLAIRVQGRGGESARDLPDLQGPAQYIPGRCSGRGYNGIRGSLYH